jgi:ribonuclease Z
MFRIIFLGTTAMVPTKDRNHSGIYISFENVGMLFDCGEGTQRQLRTAEIRPTTIKHIFLSHLEGDHVLGLPGLIQTLAMSEYNGTLRIHGPKGTKKMFEHMNKAFPFFNPIDVDVEELGPGLVMETDKLRILAHDMDHKVPCLGYEIIEKDRRRISMAKAKKLGLSPGPVMGKLQQGMDIRFSGKKISADEVTYIVKGKRIGITGDTRLCDSVYDIAKDKDVFICESTYAAKDEDKAHEYKHMTSAQAAMVASKMNVGTLYLTHISQRYKDTKELEDDAKDIFPKSILAYDFLKIKI